MKDHRKHQVEVDAQGVHFGSYWVSHEAITGCDANLIAKTRPQYWEWVLKAGQPSHEPWMPISMAEKVSGKEILGVSFHRGLMTKEPFISFWSPTLNKFFCNPTHFQEMQIPQDDEAQS